MCDPLFCAILYSFEDPFSPVLARFAVCVFVVFLLFCLDEDRIPGRGECGRPLRL